MAQHKYSENSFIKIIFFCNPICENYKENIALQNKKLNKDKHSCTPRECKQILEIMYDQFRYTKVYKVYILIDINI